MRSEKWTQRGTTTGTALRPSNRCDAPRGQTYEDTSVGEFCSLARLRRLNGNTLLEKTHYPPSRVAGESGEIVMWLLDYAIEHEK